MEAFEQRLLLSTVTLINFPGASSTYAYGINDSGQVVGREDDASGIHGFLESGGSFTTIDVPGAIWTYATGINDSGQVVGILRRPYEENDPYGIHGFLESGGSFTTIDFPGAEETEVNGINDSGQVVGVYYDASGTPHGFLETGGSFTTIDVPNATTTFANGINDDGQVVGEYYGPYSDHNDFPNGFLESGGSFTTIDVPAEWTYATGINDGGQVVGYYETGSYTGYDHGFLESGGSFTAIDFLDSYYTGDRAMGINDAGLVVGVYYGLSGMDGYPGNQGFLLVPQAAPSFSGLSAPTITYGTATTTVSGQLDGNAGGQPVPAGETVQVTLNGVNQDATLDSNDDFSTTFDTSALTVAGSPYTIGFSYTGDANFTSASASSTLTVNQAGTTTALVGGPSPSVYGQPVTFTATVTANGPGSGTPTGSVTFMDGTTALNPGGTMLDDSGTATFTTTTLAAGDHPAITAVYGGDTNFSGSTSAAIDQFVGPHLAATSLTWASDGGVDYGYSISGADLPQATTVDLDWASGTTVNTVIGSPITSTTTETAQGTYSLHATPAQLGAPPPGAEDLLVVVDPNNTISPADPSKIANLVLPNISVTSLIWHPDDETTWTSDPVDSGGVDFDYTITGSALPKAVPIDLYWASGTTLANKLGSPISENDDGTPIMTETTQGSYQVHISAIRLGTPPPGSTDLLVVADPPDDQDPAGLIIESNQEDNLQALGASASDILANSIHVSIVGSPQITAMFMPAEGSSPPAENQPAQGALSLVQAEAILGINHFNWIQHYVMPSYEHEYLYYGTLLQRELVSPIIDPDDVSGNQSNLTLYSVIAGRDATFHELSTDSWPYYWDEPSELQDKGQLPSGSSNPSALFFEDTPMQPDDFLKPSDSWSFTTELAGVTAGPTYSEIPLALTPFFSWYSNAVYDHIKFPYPYSGGGVFMKSTDSTILPPLLSGGVFDVQVGVEQATSLSSVSGTGAYGGIAALTATLTSGGSPVAGETVTFTLTAQGTPTTVGTATTDPNGVATLTGVSLTGFAVGTSSGVITASFAGDSTYAASTASGSLTVSPRDVSSQVSVTSSGLVYNRSTQRFGGTMTLTNTGTSALDFSFEIVLANLSAGVTLANATGYTADGDPYILVNLPGGALAPGQSVTFTVQFNNPSKKLLQYGAMIFNV